MYFLNKKIIPEKNDIINISSLKILFLKFIQSLKLILKKEYYCIDIISNNILNNFFYNYILQSSKFLKISKDIFIFAYFNIYA